MTRELVRILFLCVHNSCRSQMAEGWAKKLKPRALETYSAGISPSGITPMTVQVMAEVGVDISGQRSKHVNELKGLAFDYAITLCDWESEACPYLPGVEMIHHGFDDPPALAARTKTEEEALAIYRRVRDEIRDFVAGLPESLESMPR
ncbi:MAG: arsenate reductase ArsC [candidate division WS1 bacterium]|jgi:arsenate reductase|nr:arsenate reductase ArsC [candidate division WS1 bacterium]